MQMGSFLNFIDFERNSKINLPFSKMVEQKWHQNYSVVRVSMRLFDLGYGVGNRAPSPMLFEKRRNPIRVPGTLNPTASM